HLANAARKARFQDTGRDPARGAPHAREEIASLRLDRNVRFRRFSAVLPLQPCATGYVVVQGHAALTGQAGKNIMDDNTARRTKKAASETMERVQESASQATEGFREYQVTVLAAAQDNINGAFEYVQEIVMARSVPELIETSTRHSRLQLERVTEQARQI